MAVCPSDCSPHASLEPAVIRALPLFLLAACLGGDPPAATPADHGPRGRCGRHGRARLDANDGVHPEGEERGLKETV